MVIYGSPPPSGGGNGSNEYSYISIKGIMLFTLCFLKNMS